VDVSDPEELGVDDRVGIDEHERVVHLSASAQASQQPLECRTLPGVVGIVVRVSLEPVRPDHVHGAVGAVVRDDVHGHQLFGVIHLRQALQRRADETLLVVSRDQHAEPMPALRAQRRPTAPTDQGPPRRRGEQGQVSGHGTEHALGEKADELPPPPGAVVHGTGTTPGNSVRTCTAVEVY
jgi:hypothetical protein